MTPRPSRVPRLAPRFTTEISRTKTRVRDLERLLESRPRSSGGLGLGAVVSIAAANTADTLKRSATYVATGASDQDVFVECARLLPAGADVLVLPGDFYFDDRANLGFDSRIRLLGSGRDAVVIHQTGTIGIVNAREVHDLAVKYEGDPAVGRYGISAGKIHRCRLTHEGAHATEIVETQFFGTYAPGHGYISGLDFLSSAQFYDRCRFAIQAPDDDLAYLPTQTSRFLDSTFENAMRSLSEGSEEWLPMLARSLVHLGNAPFDAPQSIIRGAIAQIQASGGDEESPAFGLVEYGIRAAGESYGSIVEGNSLELVGTDPEGFTSSGDLDPFIVGLDYTDSKVTIRNNFGMGGLASDPTFFDYLPELGFGT